MFQRKNVDSIMKGFNKMIVDLETIISDEVALNVKREEEIALMKGAQVASAVEIGRAQGVINNLKKLIGG